MKKFVDLFGRNKGVIIGMIHLRALPGSPKTNGKLGDVIKIACSEAEMYKSAKVDAIMVENMHDQPWLKPEQLGPETIACMTAACWAVREVAPHLPMGVQVLSACNREAVAIAKATDLNFVRAEGFVFSHIGDKGPIHSCAADLTRYRKHIDAEHIHIYTDVKKKHCSHTITSDISIADTAKAAELFLSDGIVVSGVATGQPTNPQDVKDVQEAVSLPVLIGSGVTEDNLARYLSANAIIIGSHLKQYGLWHRDIDRGRLENFMAKVWMLRGKQAVNGGSRETSGREFTNINSQGE